MFPIFITFALGLLSAFLTGALPIQLQPSHDAFANLILKTTLVSSLNAPQLIIERRTIKNSLQTLLRPASPKKGVGGDDTVKAAGERLTHGSDLLLRLHHDSAGWYNTWNDPQNINNPELREEAANKIADNIDLANELHRFHQELLAKVASRIPKDARSRVVKDLIKKAPFPVNPKIGLDEPKPTTNLRGPMKGRAKPLKGAKRRLGRGHTLLERLRKDSAQWEAKRQDPANLKNARVQIEAGNKLRDNSELLEALNGHYRDLIDDVVSHYPVGERDAIRTKLHLYIEPEVTSL